MKTLTIKSIGIRFALCLSLLGILLMPATVLAETLNLKTQLIWGTSQEKVENPNVKEVEADLSDKLRKIFKWKSYYEVSNKQISIASKETKKVRMSQKCEVEIKSLGEQNIEVNLWGEGKLVVTKHLTVNSSTAQVIAGDDRNDSAWFVVITPAK
jgi:hypothetical protein